MRRLLSRREILRRAAAAGAVSSVPTHILAQALPDGARPVFETLTRSEAEILEAIVARLIPSDENGPGALEAGAAYFIDRALAGALAESREFYSAGLVAIDSYAEERFGRAFTELDPGDQDSVLLDLEQNRANGFSPVAASFFDLVLDHTIQGTFCDPYYGGNRDFIGWEMLGYPGVRLGVGPDQQRMDVLPQMTRVSAYDLPSFDPERPDSRDDDDG